MTVYIGHAVGDEHGQGTGGKTGNQTGKELRTQAWYLNKKGWRALRAKSPEAAARIAEDMRAACDNPHIRYNKDARSSLYKAAKPYGWDAGKVEKDVDCDCSALVRVCVCYALRESVPDFYTGNEVQRLLQTGAFEELIGDDYTKRPDKLRAGDILVTCTKGHTCVVLTDGPKAYEDEPKPEPEPEPGPSGYVFTRLLKYGCVGEDVVELKRLLIARGYDKGITVDTKNSPRFASSTRRNVKNFQRAAGIQADGIAGPVTITELGGDWDG